MEPLAVGSALFDDEPVGPALDTGSIAVLLVAVDVGALTITISLVQRGGVGLRGGFERLEAHVGRGRDRRKRGHGEQEELENGHDERLPKLRERGDWKCLCD